ncbi:TetR/AcrR family transcriptional regulator [Streptomyces sp. 4F14]|uniref:TetR/AcrR family transcriptional regulator n=1 Tax=Streptomyces sp. 4F14 TaxID=3394380 RepID=UPI003A8972F3
MTVWDRPEPPARPVPLDRERIVAAAITLADEGGLEAVSVRKVAGRLNAGPMRLYGFMATKEELYDLMVDEVQGEILIGAGAGAGAGAVGVGGGGEVGAEGEVGGAVRAGADASPSDWRETLRALAHRTRRTALRHEWLADLLGGRPALGPNGLAVTEAKLAALDGLTDIDTALRATETISAYVTGALRREIAHLRAVRVTGLTDSDWQRASGSHVTAMLATGRFPALARAVHDGSEVDAGVTFATGLEWVLDGVAARLTR